MRQLAENLGCNTATDSRAVALARLPDEIVALFASPTDLQTRWAAPLTKLASEGLQVGPERARTRLKGNPQMSPSEIFVALSLGDSVPRDQRFNANPEMSTLCLGGRRIGEVLQDAKSGTTVPIYEKLPLPTFGAVAQGIQRAVDKF